MNIPSVDNWLSQFDIADRHLAGHMLKKMRYVSFEEIETWLQNELQNLLAHIAKESGKSAVAIFPVTKPFIHQFNKSKEVKHPNDSSGRIAHSIKNLERRLPNHIELTPRPESMRARKVRHIIFVDDFIGTGDRFISSWQQVVSKSVKSWCSHGWCKIWILAFAGHESGIKRIITRVKPIESARVWINLRISKSFISENDSFVQLIEKYGQRLFDKKGVLGYGKLLSPIVFQHGCPNNVPNIFWSKASSSKGRWKPLFPARSVPPELYPLFSGDLSKEIVADEIWMAKNYKLAVEIVDRLDHIGGEHLLLVVLAYLGKNNDLGKIRNILVLSDEEFQELLVDLSKYGLINAQNKITCFGRDVLARFARSSKTAAQPYDNSTNFYPATFLGFQREV